MSQVLLFSLTAMLNPTLVAATTVMLLLPSPKKLMLGYLLGALLMSVTVGLVIVFAAKNSGVVNTAKKTINPVVDFTLGAILVAIAVVLCTGRDTRLKGRRRRRKGKEKAKKTPRWRRTLSKGDPRATFVVGAMLSLPGASYLAALTNVAKLKYNTVETVLVVLLINMIMLGLVEVPLISFAIAPDWTPTAVTRVKVSFSRNGRKIALIGSAAIGSLLIVQGLITLLS